MHVCVCVCVSTSKLFHTWKIISIWGRSTCAHARSQTHTHTPEPCTVTPRPVSCNSRVLRSRKDCGKFEVHKHFYLLYRWQHFKNKEKIVYTFFLCYNYVLEKKYFQLMVINGGKKDKREKLAGWGHLQRTVRSQVTGMKKGCTPQSYTAQSN